MGNINVLGFEIANLIAAGEVVERPASVVKELVENSIDAGATSVVVEIKQGGVALIRVTDNGVGMDPEDLPVSIRRHATSKIREAEDLEAIATLGFRGEALAAIASVCILTIVTKQKDAPMGALLRAEGGVVTDLVEVGSADGTVVSVENLFGAVPARRKFLKKDKTEAMAVGSLLEKIALSRPDVAIRFISDGTVKFSTAGDGDAKSALYALYGRELAGALLPVEGTVSGVSVSGFVGTSQLAKGTRSMQNFFINGRYVRSKTATAALEQAFTSYMAPEKFPVCCLFITVDCDKVDVNVHPTKMEVRFSDERSVFESVYYGVRSALEKGELRPDLYRENTRDLKGKQLLGAFTPLGGQPKSEQLTISTPLTQPSADTPARPAAPSVSYGAGASRPASYPRTAPSGQTARVASDPTERFFAPPSAPEPKRPSAPIPTSPATPTCSSTPEPVAAPSAPWRILGVAFDCYILVESGDELLLIDQHAAHERVLFEQMLRQTEADGRVASQSLLVPLTFSLSQECAHLAAEETESLGALGYAYTVEGGLISLSEIPLSMEPSAAQAFFEQLTFEMSQNGVNPSVLDAKRREKTLYQMACKAAIKGGRHYDEAHLRWLCDTLQAMPDVTVCPHGRPIAVRLTRRELDHRFGRI